MGLFARFKGAAINVRKCQKGVLAFRTEGEGPGD